MEIDIEGFLKEHKIYPLSQPGWKICQVCHYIDMATAQVDGRLGELQASLGRKAKGVYVYFDSSGDCIYVGKSADLADRFKKHFQRTYRRDKSDKRGKHFKFWSGRPGDMTIKYFLIDKEVDRKVIEIMLIHLLEPAFEKIPRSRS